jgi:hypothetical protein
VRLVSATARIFAVGYWLWSATIAVVAGFFGAVLACEYGCRPGSPPWLQPWEWGNYYVNPEATIIGLGGLLAATTFARYVVIREPRAAAVSFIVSLVLLSYPFFGGLTEEGRGVFAFGPVVGLASLVALRSA